MLLRVWFAIGYWGSKQLTHDAQEYFELAKSFNQTGRLELPERQTNKIESYGRAPGYPLWLAFLQRLSPTLSWLRLAEALLNLVCTYLFFSIVREMFGLRAGIIAFVISCFYIPLIVLAPVLLSENFWLFCMLLSYWFLWRKHTNIMASFGLLGIATLIRPGTVFLLPFYFLWARRKYNIRSAILLAAFYFLILVPWNVYLFNKHHRFIFIASEGGVTLWTGTHPQYSGDGDLAVNPDVQKEYRKLLESHRNLTAEDRADIYTDLAIQHVIKHPIKFIHIEVKKLIYWVLPIGPSVMQMSLLHKVASFLFYLPLLVLSVIGFRRLSPDAKFFVAGIYVSFTIMVLVFLPQERFRIATIDPLLILVSANELAHRLLGVQRSDDPAKNAIIGV